MANNHSTQAGTVKDDGSEIDITSRLLFSTISDIGGCAKRFYETKDLLAEIRNRLAVAEVAGLVKA